MSDAAGEVYQVAYPFFRESVTLFDESGHYETMSWRPGVRFEMSGPEDSEAFADGIGLQIITVVSTHKPGRFPLRYFYTRRWRDPDGKEFGKPRLRITSGVGFKNLIKGYRFPFTLATKAAA